jgi:hypothetical protein
LADEVVLFIALLVLSETNIESSDLIVLSEVMVDQNIKCKEEVVEDVFVVEVVIHEEKDEPDDCVNSVEN